MKNKILSVISVWFIALYTINAQIVLQKQTERDGIVTSLRFRTDTVPVAMDKAKEILNSINKIMQTITVTHLIGIKTILSSLMPIQTIQYR